MDILKMHIVKQPNGKFALYDTSACEFYFTNARTPQEIKDRLISKVDRILDENIKDHARDTRSFEIFVSDFMQAKGLPPDEEIREAAISELAEMGVSVEGF